MNFLKKWLFDEARVARGEVFAALDIGSSKIACLIARSENEGSPRVVCIGHQLSEGMKHGGVSNMEALQYAIGQAVTAAEQMAGETLQRVTVNISSAQLTSQSVDIELPLNGREVTENDLARILAQGQTMLPDDCENQLLELLQTVPTGYSIDGQKNIRDPLGMTGSLLHTQMHLIAAGFGPVRTLATAIARCHLDVEQIVASPYASGLACLVEDEMDLGSLIIDMGAGTTSYAVFFDGAVVHTGGVPLGGAHITNDIARGLTTSVAQAERLKTLFGNAIQSPMDERETIDVPLVGEEETPSNANHLPKAHLIRIIQPRIEEIFSFVKAEITRLGCEDMLASGAVITGGATQLPGMAELAEEVLGIPVRLGMPKGVGGLADVVKSPAFSTGVGLVQYGASQQSLSVRPNTPARSGGGIFSRLRRVLSSAF